MILSALGLAMLAELPHLTPLQINKHFINVQPMHSTDYSHTAALNRFTMLIRNSGQIWPLHR
jgi:hypothetical protein